MTSNEAKSQMRNKNQIKLQVQEKSHTCFDLSKFPPVTSCPGESLKGNNLLMSRNYSLTVKK